MIIDDTSPEAGARRVAALGYRPLDPTRRRTDHLATCHVPAGRPCQPPDGEGWCVCCCHDATWGYMYEVRE